LNNVFTNIEDWTVGAGCGAQILLEGNTFENVDAATRVSNCSDGTTMGLINAKAGSNLYRDSSDVHLGGTGDEPRDSVFAPAYDYSTDLAQEAFSYVVLRAGAGGPWALSVPAN
jgi:pectate lyase